METFCHYFNQSLCRSCQWIDQDYALQLAEKTRLVSASLNVLRPFELRQTVGSPQVQAFRNRAKMTVTGSTKNPVIGLTGLDDLDAGQKLLDCPIHHPRLNELMHALPDWIRTFSLIPYHIKDRNGELKGLIAFYSPLTDEMYLRFVLRSKEAVSRLIKAVPLMQAQFPSLHCISANIQSVPHAILEGPEEVFLTEKKSIEHGIGPFRLQLSPNAFVQTNVIMATELYQTAAQWISETRPKRMLDLYCGQGAFSFFAAQAAETILGIEISRAAVASATDTAQKLGFSHLSFKCADATCLGQEIRAFSPNLILVNPPRRGLGTSLSWILDAAPAHILYSSCAIESLVKDLGSLSARYQLQRVQVFDLFPHTAHFETLVWLSARSQ